MNRELIGEPGISAFLRSVLQNLGNISRMKPNYNTYLYYDPTQDLEKLREKLVLFQGLVVDGEAKRLDDPGADEWMDEINDLLYDVEDIFDDIKSLWKDQVSVNYSLLNEFSDGLNSRFQKILARAQKLGEKAETLKLERVTSGHVFRGETKVSLRTRETSSVVDISEIHGREDDKTGIVKRLLEVDGTKGKKNYNVLCIVGMGGLGKTTVAQLVFNAPEVVNHFDVKSWVCISNVFDVKRATKELIENSSRGGGGGGGDQLQQSLAGLQSRLRDLVRNKKILFVLDDVWSSSEWGEMKGPFSSCANGSKILVTTRKIQIAHALGNKDPYQLLELKHEKCLEIFMDNAFGDDEGEQERVHLVEKIVRACGGVPLVVKVIGSMLQSADVEKWRALSENTASWTNNNDEIHPAIRFSYHDLPSYLKRCFEYLAVFPPEYKLKQNDVVRMWIAGGLVDEKEGRIAEDIGAEYYNELKVRSLIQGNDMMHDIVHHLATVVSRKFCYKENSKEPPASMRHAYVADLNEMHCKFFAEAPGLRTLIVKQFEDENVLRNTIRSCKMLRTLLIDSCSDYENFSLGESCIDHLTHIRYLTIHDSDIRHLPDSPCMLNNLQFLNLSDNTYLENLIDLRIPVDSSISSLPESICALSRLEVLDLGCCSRLKELPKDIGTLKSLRRINLRGNSISSLPESICALSQLQVLKLVGCDNIIKLPEDIADLKSLRTLDLWACSISSLPESTCSLSQLQVLNLRDCGSLIQLPEDIGNLRMLQKLDLRKTSISSLPESICALSQLQVLNIEECGNLMQLPKDIGNLRSLRTLDIRYTSMLSVPESILNITGLQYLLVGIQKQLPLHIGRLTRLKKLTYYHVGKEEGRGLGELNLMNRLEGRLRIGSMENIGGVEEAQMADLKNKKTIRILEFQWSEPGTDEEMQVKIMEALEPHHALQSLKFSNYGGHKFPAWIMASNVCFSNLRWLSMEGLNKISEITDMEFVSLEYLTMENCPKLRKVLMATPKLRDLYTRECGELEAGSVYLLPSLSDKDGLHFILSRLEKLECAYNIFEYFCEKLKTANSKWDKLLSIELNGRGTRLASLPVGWPSLMGSLQIMRISKIEQGRFQFVPDGDQSDFPRDLHRLLLNNCLIKERLPHQSYTISSDGEINLSKKIYDTDRVGQTLDKFEFVRCSLEFVLPKRSTRLKTKRT